MENTNVFNRENSITISIDFDHHILLNTEMLTFRSIYEGVEKHTSKTLAALGFDICSVAARLLKSMDEKDCFYSITGIRLTEENLSSSRFASVETKVFETVNEVSAIYSFGVLLGEVFLWLPEKSLKLKRIIQKASHSVHYERYASFMQMQNDFAAVLEEAVSREKYGIFITDKYGFYEGAEKSIESNQQGKCYQTDNMPDCVQLEAAANSEERKSFDVQLKDDDLQLRKYEQTKTEEDDDEKIVFGYENDYSIEKGENKKRNPLRFINFKNVSIIFIVFSFLFSSISIKAIRDRKELDLTNDIPTLGIYENYG